MTREVVFKGRFKKALRLMEKRGKNAEKLYAVMRQLAREGMLPRKYNPHKLSGDCAGEWECHIESDWLLVYDIDDETLTLCDTGTHSDIFG